MSVLSSLTLFDVVFYLFAIVTLLSAAVVVFSRNIVHSAFSLMFTFFSLSFPAGLGVYWVASTIIGIVMQYFITGWGSLQPTLDRVMLLFNRDRQLRQRVSAVEKKPTTAPPAAKAQLVEGSVAEAGTEVHPASSGGGTPPKGTKRKQRGSGGGRSKRK